jgi:hypothetical protein
MKFLAILSISMLMDHSRHSAFRLWIGDSELENLCFIFSQFRPSTQVNECNTNIKAFNKSRVTTFGRSKEHIMLNSCWRYLWSGLYPQQLDLAVGNLNGHLVFFHHLHTGQFAVIV